MKSSCWLGSVCVLAAVAGESGAQIVSRESVHLRPAGAVVSGSFTLVNRRIPLPEGEFTLVASEIRAVKLGYGNFASKTPELVDVYLGQVVDHKLRAAVAATALLALNYPRWEWTNEACKRDDLIFKLNRVPFMKQNYEQNCLTVNHLVNNLGTSASGVYAKAAGWVRDQGGAIPIATLVDAAITRIQNTDYLAVHYLFNPVAYGCDDSSVTEWAASPWHKNSIGKDAEKTRFATSVTEFGKVMQTSINDAFQGHRAARVAAPALYGCGMEPRKAAPAAIPSSVTERLRVLQELRDQKVITPEEYEERRRSIINSL